uniref:Uncharacterized protein n=1 Tax=Spongospora subterranea TaxID=70186 RepID=A0A0H5R6A0_9EUKA|eukprot:CRZ09680.1 hypothetical protein [Spongospora subterranea]
MPVLDDSQLRALAKYQYSSGLYGYIDTIMTPFWNWAVTLLPMTLAPNLVTLLALLFMSLAAVLVATKSPMLTDPLPPWVLVYSATSLFIYQTLDAIDGKQARRTKSSSALGQLFDHGCDSINITLLIVCIGGCICAGDDPKMIAALFVVSVLPFYMANWEEYQTGIMRFGKLGVTEAQHIIIAMMLTSALFGPQIWKATVFGWEWRQIWLTIATAGSGFSTVENVLHVFCQNTSQLLPSHSRSVAVAQVLQFASFVILTVLWMLSPQQAILFKYPFLSLVTAGASFSYMINRLIIAHVTHCDRFNSSLKVLWPLPIVTFLAWFVVSTRWFWIMFHLYTLYVVAIYFRFVYSAINEICAFLKIQPFFITPRTN